MTDTFIWGGIALIALILLVVCLILWKKGRIKPRNNYYSLFVMGVIFIPVGAALENPGLWGVGVIYAIIGLVNKKKWNEPGQTWSELTPAQKKTKIILLAIATVLVLAGLAVFFLMDNNYRSQEPTTEIESFQECVAAGHAVMESYPRQCRAGNKTFIEDIGNELEKINLIRADSPRPNAVIKSPLEISGQARGFWFFEADFPIILTDWDGRIIGQAIATAQEDWMTEDFVPFTATLEFETPYQEGSPDFMKRGAIIFQKDNPSGLPEHDDALEFTVYFE